MHPGNALDSLGSTGRIPTCMLRQEPKGDFKDRNPVFFIGVVGLAQVPGQRQLADAGLFFQGGGRFFTLWNPEELMKMGDDWAAAKAACEALVGDAKAKRS